MRSGATLRCYAALQMLRDSDLSQKHSDLIEYSCDCDKQQLHDQKQSALNALGREG